LRKTVDKYNEDVEMGKDSEFGRTTLVGEVGKLVKIDAPPFYAYESKGNLPSTYGGIAIDEEMHVLNQKGRIPGLYAAGDVTDTEFKQAITGVAEGVTAVYHAYKYVTGEFVCTCIDLDYLECPAAPQDLRRSPS
jgi:thioredoxin reductase